MTRIKRVMTEKSEVEESAANKLIPLSSSVPILMRSRSTEGRVRTGRMRGEGVDACGAGIPDPASRGIPSVGGYYGPRVSRPIKAGSAPELEVGDPKNRRAERRRRTHPANTKTERRRRRRSAHPSLEGRDPQTPQAHALRDYSAMPERTSRSQPGRVGPGGASLITCPFIA